MEATKAPALEDFRNSKLKPAVSLNSSTKLKLIDKFAPIALVASASRSVLLS